MTIKNLFLVVLLGLSTLSVEAQFSKEIHANRDNTLIEALPADTHHFAHGSSHYFFVGRTNQPARSIRRGLLHFDLFHALPTGATLDSVSMSLHVSQVINDTVAETITMHRLSRSWGESTTFHTGGKGDTAHMGDATWFHAFYDTASWTNPGGDFITQVSDQFDVMDTGFYRVNNSTKLLQEVRWSLLDSTINHGWIFIGNENRAQTAKRFDSGENPTDVHGPILTLYYTMPSTVDDLTAIEQGVQLYPNPASDQVTLSTSSSSIKFESIAVYNLNGAEVYSFNPNSSDEVQLDVSEWKVGQYVLRIQTNEGSLSRTLIKD